jgi:hypothetical protein
MWASTSLDHMEFEISSSFSTAYSNRDIRHQADVASDARHSLGSRVGKVSDFGSLDSEVNPSKSKHFSAKVSSDRSDNGTDTSSDDFVLNNYEALSYV